MRQSRRRALASRDADSPWLLVKCARLRSGRPTPPEEIKSLITESVERVDAGSQLVNEAGQTMTDIVDQVHRVTDLIGEITSATLEQSNGIGQVNQAVTQLDRMTQQNAALVEQSAAAASSLRDQAEDLASAVDAFKVSGEAGVVIRRAQEGAKAASSRREPTMGGAPALKAGAGVAARVNRAPEAPKTAPQSADAIAVAAVDDSWKAY
jgi:hypothetical protein